MKRSDLWRQRAAHLTEFIEAARDLEAFYDDPTSDDSRERDLRTRVAETARPAGATASLLGLFTEAAGRRLNPILAWERFIPGELLSNPHELVEFAELTCGMCQAKPEQAANDEGGFLGRRPASGSRPHSARREANWRCSAHHVELSDASSGAVRASRVGDQLAATTPT